MADKTDKMSPSNSPSSNFGGRRVNNMPLFIIAGVGVIFIIMVVMVAASRNNTGQNKGEEKKKTKDSAVYAESLTHDKTIGIVPAKEHEKKPEKISGKSSGKKPQQENKTLYPQNVPAGNGVAAPRHTPAPKDPWKQEKQQIKRKKFQMLARAAQASTDASNTRIKSERQQQFGSTGNSRQKILEKIEKARYRASHSEDPTQVYKQKLKALKASGLLGNIGGGSSEGIGGGKALAQAGNAYQNDDIVTGKWTLNSKVQAPQTDYVLRSGFVIPGTTISGINSDLPGPIVGQVSQNVYDTATGNHLLIPQGSKLLAEYDSDVIYGQSRVLVVWKRIIFPDGKALDIGTMPGADQAGHAGFKDKVNNHYFRIFGSAILMSAISAGMEYATDDEQVMQTKENGYGDEMQEALAEQLGQVTLSMIEKNLNIAPTLEVRPGYRFNIMVVKDFVMDRPYRAFDY